VSRALVQISPASRGGGHAARRDELAAQIAAALAKRGMQAELVAAGSAQEVAANLHDAQAAGYDLAVVAGGDGTVRLAVGSLAGTALPLGIVPLGTGNLLAATLGIPRDPRKAIARLITAQPLTIDTGVLKSNGANEAFAVAAGAGFDARVMTSTSSALKARFGVLAYFATIVRLLPSLPSAETEIEVDGRTFTLPTVAVLVANCGQLVPGLVGPRLPLDPTDGLLDVVAIRSGSVLSALPTAAGSALDSLFRDEHGVGGSSLRQRGQSIRVRTNPPEPIQVDGDLLPIQTGSFQATVKPKSLTVLV
jgi:diacylglycerol kinase family enzyme